MYKSIRECVYRRFLDRKKKRTSYTEKSLRTISKEINNTLNEWKAKKKHRSVQRNAYYWHNNHWQPVAYTDALDMVDHGVSVETIGYTIRLTHHRRTKRKTVDITPEGFVWKN